MSGQPFWAIFDEEKKRSVVMEMDHRFQEAVRLSLSPKPRDIILVEAANTEHLQKPEEPELSLDMPSWKRILYEVARKHRVFVAELLSRQKSNPLVAARHEAMYRMKTETAMSMPAIGRRMGGRDHTTVLHGVRRHKERMEAAQQ